MTNLQSKHADELIAEIKAMPYYKDNPHLIDEVSIYRWIHLSLRKFGTSVMSKKEQVIKVENYKACLPKDFGKLNLAIWCQASSVEYSGSKDKLIDSYYYTDLIKTNPQIGAPIECSTECERENRIIEKLYVHKGTEMHVHYSNLRYVKIGRKTERSMCTDKCLNRGLKDSEHSINIEGQTLYANFEKGHLYLEYFALPSDEDGIPIIPYTQNGYLEEFIEYAVKTRLLEDAMMSKDATNLQGMFQYVIGKEQVLWNRARMDTSPITMKSFWDYISKRRMDLAKYDLNFGSRTYLRHKINN